jgi:transcriptional regulator with XRE-family HTH domain
MELHERIECKLASQIASKLKQMREDSGLTADQAANLLGLDVHVLRSYESNRRGTKAGTLLKASAIYGKSIDDLLTSAREMIELEKAIELVQSAGMVVSAAD